MKHKYNEYVEESINSIISEGRYRTFANITRSCGNYPHATLYHDDGSEQQITVWCSNDYLGMGQNKDILNSIKITLDSLVLDQVVHVIYQAQQKARLTRE